jgi:tetratricopeptide (TPR) repeat protein
MFAMLGAHCGPDITVPAAASVAGVSRPDARRLVGQLAAASLVAEHRPGRYIMHDLLRGYAAEYARQVLGKAGFGRAVGRSLDHYLQTLATWDISFPFRAEPADGVLIEKLGGNAGLLSWAQAEHQVLLQATAQALATGRITKATRLFTYVAWYLGDRGWTDCEAAGQSVLAVARAAGDHSSLGWTYRAIGTYHTMLGDNAASFGYLRQALDHCRLADDKSGQAYAHLALATAYGAQPAVNQPAGYVEAASYAEHGLALCRDVGDQKGQAYALYYLCEINADLGNYELALRYGQQGMDLLPDGDWWRGVLVSALGNVYQRFGDYARAIACYDEALTINDEQQPSARQGRASLLTELGTAHEAAGNLPAACQAWQQALQIVEDLQLRDDLGYYDIGLRARLRNAGALGY